MNPDKDLQNLAVSLTVTAAQLLAHLQAPHAESGSRDLHHYVDKLSGILEDLEEAIEDMERTPSALVDEEQADDDRVDFNASDQVLCRHCELPIPEARRKAVPGTPFCVICAEEAAKRHTDPFAVVTERDVKRFQNKHQQETEDERLHALARRPSKKGTKSRGRRRRKSRSTK